MKGAVSTLGKSIRAEVLAAAASGEQNARDQMQPVEASEFGDAEDGCTVEQAQRFYARELVDRFQQAVHDQRTDATWPPCPKHPNHPLWYDEDNRSWCCPRDGARVAPLGQLTDIDAPAA